MFSASSPGLSLFWELWKETHIYSSLPYFPLCQLCCSNKQHQYINSLNIFFCYSYFYCKLVASKCLLSSAPCIFSFQHPNWKMDHYLGNTALMTVEEEQKIRWQKLRVLLRASAWTWHIMSTHVHWPKPLGHTQTQLGRTHTPPSEGTIGNEAMQELIIFFK